jgi:tetratricopeptide (TPR) repeat protein
MDFEYFCRVKWCLHIVSFLVGLAMLVACSKPVKVEVSGSALRQAQGPQTQELSQIDTLMWHQPDSALAVMMEFAGSPEADSLNEFEGHYCQVLIAELLFKNDYVQSNRKDLLKAVAYFDSLTFTLNDIPHASRRHCGLDPQSPNQNDNIVFLSARAHYMNGVGFYERDSVVAACGEYLKALEMVETHFPNVETVCTPSLPIAHLPRFMALTYGRLGDLFSKQYMQEPAIICYKKALIFNSIEPISPNGTAKTWSLLTKQYYKINQLDSAKYCLDESLRLLYDTNNMIYRDLISLSAVVYFDENRGGEEPVNDLKRMAVQSPTEDEKLTRYNTIANIYYLTNQYDSALVYFTQVFENKGDAAMKRSAARFLRDIYQSRGDTLMATQYAVYQVENAVSQAESNAQVSQLNELFQQHLQWEQERAEAERQQAARLRRNKMNVVVSVLVAVAALLAWLLIRRKMKQQRDTASQQMEAVQEAHRLENQRMEAEREAHRLEKASMSGRLKRSNQELRELKDQMRQQAGNGAPKQEAQAVSFNEEPICRLIMERVNEGQFKAQMDCKLYQDYALGKEQVMALREAADRHFGQFTSRLAKAYPTLTKGDLDYCCLYLLGLSDADVAALMQRAYATVSERSRKIKTIFGTEEPLSVALMSFASGSASV